MKIKSAVIVFTPPILVVLAIAILNPTVLTWPVAGILAVAIGVFGGFTMHLFD